MSLTGKPANLSQEKREKRPIVNTCVCMQIKQIFRDHILRASRFPTLKFNSQRGTQKVPNHSVMKTRFDYVNMRNSCKLQTV